MTARRLLAAAAAPVRALCRGVQPALPAGPPGIIVLAYHLVGAGTGSPVDLPEATFRRQMKELHARGGVVPLRHALELVARGEAPAADRVVLTFDDAFENFSTRALPVLAELALPATLFVPTDFVDGTAPAPLAGAEHLPAMSWEQLRSAAAAGVELGSHTRSHPDLRGLPDARLEAEIAGSADVLAERTGVRPATFCYPRALRDRRAEERVRRTYAGAVVGGGRKNRPGRVEPWRLQRVSLRRDMPPSLGPLLGAGVALEEWLAERGRRARRPPPRRSGLAPGDLG